jgi:hypothetical protein
MCAQCAARLPANHRQSRGWREAHRKKVLLQHDATRLSAACSPPPSSAQPQKALPGRPCWQCLESREANLAGVLPLRLASAVWTSHFTSFHTTRFTLHISHFTPHTSHLTPHTSHNRESPVPLLRIQTNTQNRPLLILRRGAGCVIVGEGCDGTNSIDGSPTRGDASASSAHTIHWAGIMRSA